VQEGRGKRKRGLGTRELFNSAPGENPSQFLCGWIMGYKCASVRACIMQDRVCVCVCAWLFFMHINRCCCMHVNCKTPWVFVFPLVCSVWRASCLPVCLCVCVCLLDSWCDKWDTGVGEPFSPL